MQKARFIGRIVTGLLAAIAFSGCSGVVMTTGNAGPDGTLYLEGLGGSPALPRPFLEGPVDNVSYWDGDGVAGAASITIDLSQQRAFFFKGERLVAVSRISSGNEQYPTTKGSFKIIQKSKDHRSNLYGDFVDRQGRPVIRDVESKDTPPPGLQFLGAAMPNFMRFHGAIGMHGGFLPGYPASHGCVRMPDRMSEHFFRNVSIGTPVKVVD
jgi:hypothetical protein